MKTNLPTLPSPTYPHTIENGLGEKLTFLRLQPEPDGDRLLVENTVTPNQGPPMHTHWLQDECLTVVQGLMAYQLLGQPAQYAGPGETVLFRRGTPHRFWNAGDDLLRCQGWIKPAHTIVFFLSAVFDAQVKSGQHRPEQFDAAYLMTRYAREYDMTDIPSFVKRVVIPATYRVGRLLGKYRKFAGAPAPVRE
ncbi:cupin domain-containing protein [Hymenobacter jeollabukensis]|uniref:Cupin domain-containing protein n=1 Tax=Hymenobacter jeollabukensis TaxID=2025313 RepID=A0A5R8WM23_9BACT|nr:cupin domain-containing protein [Hymenobacter jeollabukensis]TLM90008.1 cupin domain-containing protein [Hymenobacter jeollabukensis]